MSATLKSLNVCPDSEDVGIDLDATTDRSRWLAERMKGIGGSDVPAILGMSRWSSPRDVWLDKLGRSEPKTVTWAMRKGNALEADLLDWFTETTRRYHSRVGLQRNKSRPWMLGTPDAISDDGGIVECKTTSWRMRDEWDDGPSDYAVLQGQWYLAVTGRSHLWVVAAVGDDDPTVERVERDDSLITTLIDTCQKFWHNHVIGNVEPPLMWMDRDALAAQFDRAGEHTASIGGNDLEQWIERRNIAVREIKILERVKSESEAHLIEALGDADHLVIAGLIAATRKEQTASVLDRDALIAAGINLEQYKTTRTSRVLRIPAKRAAWKEN